MNHVKVFVLLAGMTALFGVVGSAIGGTQGMWMALALAGVMNFIAYFTSSKTVLKAYGARVVGPEDAPDLYAVVDGLRRRAGLPMPTVAIAPQEQANAFATGRNPDHAVVCVTEGLLRLVDRDELEGVLAHELGHIKNRDMLLQTVAATLSGAIGNLARLGMYGLGNRSGRRSPFALIAALIAPLAGMVLQFAISRSREFKADATGAEISGKPLALASALEKLEFSAKRNPLRVSPSMGAVAQVNPLAGFGGPILRLFATHPSTAERVARLRTIAEKMGH